MSHLATHRKTFFTSLMVGIGLLFIVNSFLLSGMKKKIADEKQAAEIAAKPAEVTTTLLTAGAVCPECFDITQVKAALMANSRIRITKDEVVEYMSDVGKKLIQEYDISQVPAILIRGDTQKAAAVFPSLESGSRKAADGALVISNLSPPYVEVASNAVRGKSAITYLSDKDCTDCYDVTVHRRILGQFLGGSEETFIDSSDTEGKRLITEYKIERLPTILLSGDLSVYPRLAQVWSTVGTVEQDGTYVFREGVRQMGAYYDLKTLTVVKPAPEPRDQASSAPTAPPSTE